ncbi:CvfD/Ygs/GSP13 family RNA-binding post-transcriptional regulator [Alkalibacterium sp. 20]|uniref:CvfD/Ygs/GSP13 family RNA-binding post-transcriptional regulator n=1 Tax=Alkalibacterium sp. 20 TaxID=1798803 RepID=UPI0009004A72|nr:CvfD/Ygs/GSP13 family RNA-binding post-transcriptional regulator [Alkalibacterium sp. 20]OJF91008.1 RNA-binding protein S1 [Alkalibacterium sp. 20]
MAYKIGQKVRGTVTGIQPYGAFISIDDETQGLVHISELKHGYIKDIAEIVSKGDEIDVMIMDIDEYSQKISLSLRSLQKPKYHPFSNRKNISRYGKKTGVGFKSIDDKMSKWTQQALRELEGKRK